MAEIFINEVMTKDPLTVRADATLADAAGAMGDRQVGSVVVVDDNNSVVGILTERDLVRAAAAGTQTDSASVERWMTAGPVCMPSDEDITSALDKMIERRFRHIPVVTGGKLAGIVSFRQLIEAAKLRKVDPWAPGTAKGLENVTIAETELSYIDGQAGRLIYRGYNAVDLALNCSFTDVWHLLYFGELPNNDSFAERSAELRKSPVSTDTLRAIASDGKSFVASLQAAISAATSALGFEAWLDDDPGVAEKNCIHLTSILPTLVASLWRLSNGEDPIDPDPALSHAANYLWMMHGTKPTEDQVIAADRYLILTAEHGMNASTFTGRVVASTGADVGMAVAAALGALSGPLHGGAPSLVLNMLDDIGQPENAQAWVNNAVESGKRIMGFGHRVYKAEDPRAACLRDTSIELGSDRVELATVTEQVTLDTLRALKPGRKLYTNVEFWSAVVLERAGIPRGLFTPTFAVSRTAGWTAHILEQVKDNRLIRPSAEYVGPRDRKLR